jgi:hypothetical protein
MAEVVLFHSVLGLKPGVISAADRLREAGHTVYTPDLDDGEVFDELDAGARKEEALGYREIARRAREAVTGLPVGLVYSGFSMGVMFVFTSLTIIVPVIVGWLTQKQTRPGSQERCDEVSRPTIRRESRGRRPENGWRFNVYLHRLVHPAPPGFTWPAAPPKQRHHRQSTC